MMLMMLMVLVDAVDDVEGDRIQVFQSVCPPTRRRYTLVSLFNDILERKAFMMLMGEYMYGGRRRTGAPLCLPHDGIIFLYSPCRFFDCVFHSPFREKINAALFLW